MKDKIDSDKLPSHIAIIMDGNGRWAKKQGYLRTLGHQSGVKAVRETTEASAELGVKYLTLYAFSTENWNRPKIEVNTLMNLLVKTIHKETETLMKNDIKLNAIGDLDKLPKDCYKSLSDAIDVTKNNKRMTLSLALSYSSRWELTEAMRKIAFQLEAGKIKSADINEALISSLLCTNNIPDPELLIRTSGEFRISNFLLWQLAYAELYFTDKLWPEFRKDDLYEAIYSFQNRERRYGLTSEQVN